VKRTSTIALGLTGILAAIIGAGSATATIAKDGTYGKVTATANEQATNAKSAPVLLRKEVSDVDGDEKEDTVAYFDSDSDGVVDGEAIDLGSNGQVDVLAVRCDADDDGLEDDWLVVNAETEEIRAAMIDEDNDGVVEAVQYGNGRRQALPASSHGEIQAAFKF
jgi:hypothetical protein